MTVIEALRSTGWEYCQDGDGEAWEIDTLYAMNPYWVQQPAAYNVDRDCVVIMSSNEEIKKI